MSSVNYSLNNKGVRLIKSEDAWIIGKNGKSRLNPKYKYVGKIDIGLSNMVVSVVKDKRPTYRGNTSDLNSIAKNQLIGHFYNSKGKRNKRTVAYFGIEKKKGK